MPTGKKPNSSDSSAKTSVLGKVWKTITGASTEAKCVTARPDLQSLEERVLYDASPLGAIAAENLVESVELQLDELCELCFDEASAVELFEMPAEHSEYLIDDIAADEILLDDALPTLELTSSELIVIDSRVEGFESLIADIRAQANALIEFDVLVIGAEEDGFAKISEQLNGVEQFDAVHIVGHGTDAQINLGSATLDLNTLDQYEADLEQWQHGLADSGDILFYGCDVASSELGQELVDQISSITGADVAASDDLTGHADLGGDWEFEYTVGLIEADVVFSATAQQDWLGTLETFTVDTLEDVVDANDGLTSLREAVIAANSNLQRPRYHRVGIGCA